MFEATVRMPGTCGELVQGTMDGIHFHVSCPIDMYSTVNVQLSPAVCGLSFPPDCPKAGLAMKRTLELLDQGSLGGTFSITTSLLRGKGMASSTADIAATIEAVCKALGRRIEFNQIAQIALSIEPTDGSLFPGVVLFDHRDGQLCQPLGMPPPIDVVVLDFGGEVDTINFNNCDRKTLLRSLEPQISEARDMVLCGMATSNPSLIGQGATLSALANQRVLFKPYLEKVLSLAHDVDALGVNVAHSGTVIGVLLDAGKQDRAAIAAFLQNRLPQLEKLFLCSLIGGGSTSTGVLEKPVITRII